MGPNALAFTHRTIWLELPARLWLFFEADAKFRGVSPEELLRQLLEMATNSQLPPIA